ncbi:MAG TPA: BREX system P-loop protein BrxC, partial [Thermoanaerobaculia bacterium]|nr:BREX system P-loop protein BrxC [Thermoanaerobaculia bacterium]
MTMKNREVFQTDPLELRLVNNGVAEVVDASTDEQLRTLRYELETFVCEKQYSRGLHRILDSYLTCLGTEEQKPVWVSGFFGSGKSHLVKMLRALWVDFELPDGARARGLAHLSSDVKASLKELSTQGKRLGGLHAASGSLLTKPGNSIRLALLDFVFCSAGLPGTYAAARFVLFLKKNGWYEKVMREVEKAGKSFEKELRDLYVSPVLAKALLKADPDFAESEAKAKTLLKEQYPSRTDVTDDDMVHAIQDALEVDGRLPLTLVVLDEVQQWIGEDVERGAQVNSLAECLAKRFGARLLLVCTGQTALTGTPVLQRIQHRFHVKVELSDADVETVIRKIVLAKRADRVAPLEKLLENCSGEVSRHLTETRIGPRPEDDSVLLPDYPLLPVRRRFWEKVLRAVDRAGTA